MREAALRKRRTTRTRGEGGIEEGRARSWAECEWVSEKNRWRGRIGRFRTEVLERRAKDSPAETQRREKDKDRRGDKDGFRERRARVPNRNSRARLVPAEEVRVFTKYFLFCEIYGRFVRNWQGHACRISGSLRPAS